MNISKYLVKKYPILKYYIKLYYPIRLEFICHYDSFFLNLKKSQFETKKT